MAEKEFNIFSDEVRNDLVEAFKASSAKEDIGTAEAAEAAMIAVNDAEAAVAEASATIASAEAVRSR